MEEDKRTPIRPCGCEQTCNFQHCFGVGVMAVMKNVPGGVEIVKRVKSVVPNDNGTVTVERFCKDANEWIKESIEGHELHAVVAP